jgi:hypothetical protein
MAGPIALLIISCGAIVAGWGYVRTARRMRGYETTRGTVVAREIAVLPSTTGDTEGRWGKGGGYWPRATYTYTVAGVAHRSDRRGYAYRGLKKSVAEEQLAAIPEEVDVYFDPAKPEEAYLERHSPALGNLLVAGGGFGVLVALVLLLA